MNHAFNGLMAIALVSLCSCSQDGGPAPARSSAPRPITFEHLHVNVKDKDATAKWYVDHMGLEIIPSANKEVVYVADKDHNFMFEFSSDPTLKNNYDDVVLNAYHIAFETRDTYKEIGEKMAAHGAVKLSEPIINTVGDYVFNFKDINGFNAQLLYRTKPFYPHAHKSTVRFEHFAFNTVNQMESALWYAEFMQLTIPWSKDIGKPTPGYRNYRVPYVGDTAQYMSLELYADTAVKENVYYQQPHNVVHVAYQTEDPDAVAARMVFGGATKVGDKRIDAHGDELIDLYDPRGAPIRLIKRKTAILIR